MASVSFDVGNFGQGSSESDDDEEDETVVGDDDEEDESEMDDEDEIEVGDEDDDETEVDDDVASQEDENAIEQDDEVIDQATQDLSSDGESEVCPVCLNKFLGQELGSPENCNHTFCLQCLIEWSKNINTCPIDRTEFSVILAKFESLGPVSRRIPVHVSPREPEDALPEDTTVCEVCRSGDREDRLLLCDACDLAYHCQCLDPPLFRIPINEWFCPPCAAILNKKPKKSSTSGRQRVIPRTIVSETVRLRIQRLREGTDEDDVPPPPMPRPSISRAPVQRKPTVSRVAKRKPVRRRRRRKYTQKTVVLARTKQSVSLHGKTRVRVNVGTAVRTRRRRRRRKYRRRKTVKKTVRTKRSLLASRPLAAPSTKQRIADRLGLYKPPPGHKIPYVKKQGTATTTTSRAENLQTLKLFGNRHQLMDFGEDFSHEVNDKPKVSTVISIPGPSRCSTATGFDVLGNIMAEQNVLHSSAKDIIIGKDGSLKLKEKATESKTNSALPKNETPKTCSIVKKEGSPDRSIVKKEVDLNHTAIKMEAFQDRPVVKTERQGSCEEKVTPSLLNSRTLLIKQDNPHMPNINQLTVGENANTDSIANTSHSRVRCLSRESKISSKIYEDKVSNILNGKVKIEKGLTFTIPKISSVKKSKEMDSSDSVQRTNLLGTNNTSEHLFLTYASWRMSSNSIGAKIKSERSSNSVLNHSFDDFVEQERNIKSSTQKTQNKQVANGVGSEELTSRHITRRELSGAGHVRHSRDTNFDLKGAINKISVKREQKGVEKQTESSSKTFENRPHEETSHDVNRVKRPSSAHRTSVLADEERLPKIPGNGDHKLTGPRSKPENMDQFFNNRNVRVERSLSEVNATLDALKKRSQERMESLISSLNNVESASSSLSDDVSENRSLSPYQELGNASFQNVRIRHESVSSSINGDAVENPSLNSCEERSSSDIGCTSIKVEPFSDSIDQDTFQDQFCSLSQESRSSRTGISNIKIERVTTPINVATFENQLSPGHESGSYSPGSANIKIEPFSQLLDEDTFQKQSSSPSQEIKNSRIEISNIKTELVSSPINKDIFENRSPSPLQARESYSIKNINREVEPFFSLANGVAVQNQSPNSYQECGNSGIGSMNIKTEPLSPSTDEDALENQSPNPCQQMENFNFVNTRIKTEPLSSPEDDDVSVRTPPYLLQECNNSCKRTSNPVEEISGNSSSSEKNASRRSSNEKLNFTKAPNILKQPTLTAVGDIQTKKQKSSDADDEVLILYEKQISKTKRIKVKEERDISFLQSTSTVSDNTVQNHLPNFGNWASDKIKIKTERISPVHCESENASNPMSNFIQVKKEPVAPGLPHEESNILSAAFSIENTQPHFKKIKVEKISPPSSPNRDFFACPNLNFNAASVKSEIVPTQVNLKCIKDARHSKRKEQLSPTDVTNRSNENSPNICVLNTQLHDSTNIHNFIHLETQNSRQAKPFRKLSLSSPASDKSAETCITQDSVAQQRNPIVNDLREAVSNFFSQNIKVENDNSQLCKEISDLNNFVANRHPTSSSQIETCPYSEEFQNSNGTVPNDQQTFSPKVKGEKKLDSSGVRTSNVNNSVAEQHVTSEFMREKRLLFFNSRESHPNGPIPSPPERKTPGVETESRTSPQFCVLEKTDLSKHIVNHQRVPHLEIKGKKIHSESRPSHSSKSVSSQLKKSTVSDLKIMAKKHCHSQVPHNSSPDSSSRKKPKISDSEISKKVISDLQTSHLNKINLSQHRGKNSRLEITGEASFGLQETTPSGSVPHRSRIKNSGLEHNVNPKKRSWTDANASMHSDNDNARDDENFVDQSIVKCEFPNHKINTIRDANVGAENQTHLHDGTSTSNSQSNYPILDSIATMRSNSQVPLITKTEHEFHIQSSENHSLSPKFEVCPYYPASSFAGSKQLSAGNTKVKIEKCPSLSSPTSDSVSDAKLNVNTIAIKTEVTLSLDDNQSKGHHSLSEDLGPCNDVYAHANGRLPVSLKTEKNEIDRKPDLKIVNKNSPRSEMNQKLKNNKGLEGTHKKQIRLAVNVIHRKNTDFESNRDTLKTIEGKRSSETVKMKVKVEKNDELKRKIEKEVKRILWPFYKSGTISKQMHYDILHKSITKIMLNCNNVFNPDKIKKLICAYVVKMTKS